MVLFLLVLSVLLLLVAVALYRVHPAANLAVLAIVALLSYCVLSFSARTLMLIFPCLTATYLVCRWRDVARLHYGVFAAASIAAGWLGALMLFVPRWNEIQQLSSDYPVVRIDQRLEYERTKPEQTITATPAETKATKAALEAANTLMRRIEKTVPSEPWARHHRRAALASLERTHDDFVAAFVSQEGFGFGRMFHMPAQPTHIVLPDPEPIALDRPPGDSASSRIHESPMPVEADPELSEYHLEQTIQFVEPRGFGWALDGDWDYFGRIGATRVRGFQPHAFSTVPSGSPAGDEWQLARLELVSLLKHDPPAVYLSEHLPRMQELANTNAPTRPLNAFETRALTRLRDGETVVAEETRNRITMLGGLRAARQCLQCHSVHEGNLLGAFSYEFLRKKPLPPPDEKPTPPKPVT